MVEDYLVKAVAADGMLRIHGAVTTSVCNEAQRRHGTWPVASAALGRLLTGTLMMGAMMLKDDQKVMVQIKGDGPLQELVAVADAAGHVKGYVAEPRVDFPLNQYGKLDVSRGVGAGQLFVTRHTGLKEPYRGAVPLLSGEIGDDIAYYFAKSEQIPSVVSLGVLVETDNSVRAAGGLMVQVMPDADEHLIEQVEERADRFSNISRKIDAGQLPEEILKDVFHDLGIEILDRMSVEFRCECSKERFERGLISLGERGLQELLADDTSAEAVCQFCGAKYQFDQEDLLRILSEARAD
jgi:molecular chaperone Hsp33